MRPPICAICDERLEGDEGGLLSFSMAPGDEAWFERAEQEPGFVGHPPIEEWFCGAHYKVASGLTDRTRAEALRAIREAEQ